MMNARVEEFLREFNEVVRRCTSFCCMARAREFQVEACRKLAALDKRVAELKEQMIETKDEDSANYMLSLEARIYALKNELKMWIALKDGDPNLAWDFLVNAQTGAEVAIRAHRLGMELEQYVKHLDLLEQILFPPQVFLSSGCIVTSSKCSICGCEYGECNHLAGRPYMGKMCVQIVDGIREFTEASFVENPEDKHCRVTRFKNEEGWRDRMTWRKISDASNNEVERQYCGKISSSNPANCQDPLACYRKNRL